MRHDIAQIARMLADRAEEVCQWLLPAGKRQRNEWCAGSVYGEEGQSLRVNLAGKAGVWTDFAADEKGGDLIDLIMAVNGVGKGEAVREAKEFLGIRGDRQNFVPERKAYKKPQPPKGYKKANMEANAFFAGRMLSTSTVDAFKIAETAGDIVFPYLIDGELKFYKCRKKAKKEFWASADSEPILFGWQTFPREARSVVITEGEIDAMSFYEQGIPALSVPFGGGHAGKQDAWIECEWERLQLFDTIYLALDMDREGKKAAEYISQRLGRHRCKFVDFGEHKDANEVHCAKGNLAEYIRQAKHCDPPELRSATDYLEEVIDFFAGGEEYTGYCLPWNKTSKIIRLRKSEISVWSGINGHGKSQVVGHVTVGSIPQGERWCIASMELKPYKLLSRMYRQASSFSCPDSEQCRNIADFFDGQVFIFDVQGTAKGERILEVFEYAYHRFGCTSFLVDSLAKTGFDDDDYNGQKSFVDRLMEFSQRLNVHVHLVCHARKGKSEEDAPDKMDIKGTGAITDMVDNVFIIWRNKKKEQAIAEGKASFKLQSEPDCLLECCKQRNGEWEGKVLLWFDKASLQYKEEPEHVAKVYNNAKRQGAR